MWRVNFTRQQWLVTFTFVIVNFCNAMCVSMQVSQATVGINCRKGAKYLISFDDGAQNKSGMTAV